MTILFAYYQHYIYIYICIYIKLYTIKLSDYEWEEGYIYIPVIVNNFDFILSNFNRSYLLIENKFLIFVLRYLVIVFHISLPPDHLMMRFLYSISGSIIWVCWRIDWTKSVLEIFNLLLLVLLLIVVVVLILLLLVLLDKLYLILLFVLLVAGSNDAAAVTCMLSFTSTTEPVQWQIHLHNTRGYLRF